LSADLGFPQFFFFFFRQLPSELAERNPTKGQTGHMLGSRPTRSPAQCGWHLHFNRFTRSLAQSQLSPACVNNYSVSNFVGL